ncbi:MAG TPA: YifB family Mg chelatase-like AAA ATPase [Gammaproteobacteria bacterium]|nr:YifB family Mg chelatase-like AAA ATPase [Gammaproteobacteria bacterium]
MGLARTLSRGQAGLDAYLVTVEVHIAGGLPGIAVTGLPAAAVRESKDRVRAALATSGHTLSASRITVHLGPADIPKTGGRFDLAIALGVVLAQDEALQWPVSATEFLGELALNGDLRPINGALPAALAAQHAGHALVLPEANAAEAALVPDAEVYAAAHFKDVVRHLSGEQRLPRVAARSEPIPTGSAPDLADVRGQAFAKRALIVAAAGHHNLLMIGPPGSGKSMLAERLSGLLPPLTRDEMLRVASIASVAGELRSAPPTSSPPFRAPHHTTSPQALVGGGTRPRPGEISLAHRGVLFMDELPEFGRSALEALREPLESGVARISRVHDQLTFPAEFMLVAAMNPCFCGYLGDGTERCKCTPYKLEQYRGRISGPLLDRFDLHVEVPRVPFADIGEPAESSESAAVRETVVAARRVQLERAGKLNARLDARSLWRAVKLGAEQRALLKRAADRWQLSARSSLRVLKVARTVADLAGSSAVTTEHVAEALQLRCRDRQV